MKIKNLMRKTKKELIEIINQNNKCSKNQEDGTSCDIFIKFTKDGNETIQHIKPNNFEYNIILLDEFRKKESIEWESIENRLFCGNEIDRRCKKPSAIIKSLTKKHNLK